MRGEIRVEERKNKREEKRGVERRGVKSEERIGAIVIAVIVSIHSKESTAGHSQNRAPLLLL